MNNSLLKDFYTEVSSTFSDNNSTFESTIKLNPQHEIYKGHFAQVPVVPGVCLVQMVKEIIMNHLNKKMILSEGKNLKYLALINPNEVNTLNIQFDIKQNGNSLDVSANYLSNNVSYTKLKLLFNIC